MGAACLIAQLRAPDMIGRQPLRVVLEEEIGPVCCEVSHYQGALRAHFIAPNLPELGAAPQAPEKIAAALGLAPGDIGFGAHRPVVAQAGLPFGFVPVANLAALHRLAPDLQALGAIFRLERAAVCVYTRETADPAHHVSARVFVPGLGAGEDPATGSAACAFAAVACAYERPDDGEHTIVIEQGFAMGRPSLIALTLHVAGGELTQAGVGGACVRVGEGFLTI